MSPAKINCPDGFSFILPDGKLINFAHGFKNLTPSAQEELGFISIFGTRGGYRIRNPFSNQGAQIFVDRMKGNLSITHNPKSEGWSINLNRITGELTLGDGTRISPATKEEINKELFRNGKER